METVEIPNRPVFRASEVCEIAEVQPYVLRTWEAEFPDLGVSKTANGPRLYRRADVERVLRIKHLILVEGLTLAGARRQLGAEKAESAEPTDEELTALTDGPLRDQLRTIRRDLAWILEVLSGTAGRTDDTLPFEADGETPSVEMTAGASTATEDTPGKAPRAARKPRAAKKGGRAAARAGGSG
ncbi:MAG: MerR family transcriptional regulator [Acidobacteriota bacterium]